MGEEGIADALIVFARAPRVGHTKTRLIQSSGARCAAEIYSALLSETLRVADAIDPVQRYLYVDSETAHRYFVQGLDNARWKIELQATGDLGVRMSNAIAATLSRHRRAVLIGSDIVDLRARDLIDALYRLAGADEVVIGPAADGGYWLIGMRQMHATLFTEVAWGTSGVYRDTIVRMQAASLTWSALPCRHDIDTAQDVSKWNVELLRLLARVDNLPLT
jgi:rSAM/selenodomain-associated transferase 1